MDTQRINAEYLAKNIDSEGVLKLKIELTHSMIKTIKFIGLAQQIFGVLGFIFVAFTLIDLMNSVFWVKGIFLNEFLNDVVSIVLGVICSFYLFSSGRKFKLALLLPNKQALEEAIDKYAKYWKWIVINIIIIILITIVTIVGELSYRPIYF